MAGRSIVSARDRCGRVPCFVLEVSVKLYLIFILIDVLVLLAYPVLYVIDRVRRLFHIHR